MRILSARIFSKFFGGKIKIFNIGYLAEHLETSMNSKLELQLNTTQRKFNNSFENFAIQEKKKTLKKSYTKMPCFEERLETLRNIAAINKLAEKKLDFVIFVAKFNRYSEDFAQSRLQFLIKKQPSQLCKVFQ